MAARGNIKNLTRCLLILVSAPSLLLAATATQATEIQSCLKLGADESLAQFYSLFDGVIKSVYERAGFCAQSIPLSPKRIEQMLKAGTLDGDWIRVEGYREKFNPDLLPVPAPLFRLEVVFVSLANTDFDGSPADVAGRRVGYQAGFRWIEANLPLLGAEMVEIPAAMPIRDLLERRRFEVFATDGVRANFLRTSFADNPDALRIHPWAKMAFYHLVHKRHADKVDALKAAFNDALVDGTFDTILRLPGLVPAEPEEN